MLKLLVILLSSYFAVILAKYSHAGGKAADALAMKEKLLKLRTTTLLCTKPLRTI